jgi:hypothetical protein
VQAGVVWALRIWIQAKAKGSENKLLIVEFFSIRPQGLELSSPGIEFGTANFCISGSHLSPFC